MRRTGVYDLGAMNLLNRLLEETWAQLLPEEQVRISKSALERIPVDRLSRIGEAVNAFLRRKARQKVTESSARRAITIGSVRPFVRLMVSNQSKRSLG
jgi:hypothetical protein